jgi:hypothetical protein
MWTLRDDLMLNRHALTTVLAFALAGLALTARGGAGASPNLATQAQLAPSLISNNASILNLRGQYAGTVNDSLYGSGRIYAQLVQEHNAVAGTITFTYGSTTFRGPGVFLLKGTTLTGTGQSATLSLVPCTISETVTYSNHSLTGSYKAVRGCSGDNGTFTMKEYCQYVSDSIAEPRFGLKHC